MTQGQSMESGSPGKLRMLFVITTCDFGGSESFLHRLVSGMDRDAFEIEVCSLCPPGRVAQQIEELGIKVSTLNMDARAKPVEMLGGTGRLARLFSRSFDGRGAHGVQCLLYRANVLGALSRPLCRLFLRRPPFLVTGQRSLIPTGRSLDFRAQQATRNWADRVVAVSRAVKDELHETEIIADEKVVVIQNGIDLSRFSPPEDGEREKARAEWNIGPNTLVIGAVGRFHGPKGLKFLVEAFQSGLRRFPDRVLVLAGDGPDAEDLKAQVERLGLTEKVRFLGFQKDPRPLFPGFDIYVLPSLKEGSPNALLEAMGRRCACVASAVGGVPEALEHEKSGLLVPPGDPGALGDGLALLADDAELRSRYAAAARTRVEEYFDLKKMIRSHEALYRSLRPDA